MLGLGSVRCSIGQGKFGIRYSVKLGLGLYNYTVMVRFWVNTTQNLNRRGDRGKLSLWVS